MRCSRLRRRARRRALVEIIAPAARAAHTSAQRPVVANLRAMAEDATARPSQRVHSRAFLRRDMLEILRELEARIAAAEPPERSTPDPLSRQLPLSGGVND